MSPYTFYLHEATPPPAFEMRTCRDDDEARDYALALLDRFPACEKVEVSGYQRETFMVARPQLAVGRTG